MTEDMKAAALAALFEGPADRDEAGKRHNAMMRFRAIATPAAVLAIIAERDALAALVWRTLLTLDAHRMGENCAACEKLIADLEATGVERAALAALAPASREDTGR